MTLQPPQPSAQSGIAGCAHLTGEQFGELLARSANSPQPSDLLAETHLRTCEQCSAELASLRESLGTDPNYAPAKGLLRQLDESGPGLKNSPRE